MSPSEAIIVSISPIMRVFSAANALMLAENLTIALLVALMNNSVFSTVKELR